MAEYSNQGGVDASTGKAAESESREQYRLTVQYRPFRLVVDLPVVLLAPSAPPHRRTANERTTSEGSSRNTHPQLGKRHPDVLLEPLRELSSGPPRQRATRTCLCHRVQ